MKFRSFLLSALMVTAGTSSVLAQSGANFAVVGVYQTYSFSQSFENETGVKSASLAMLPLAFQYSVTRSVSFDIYSAYAHGSVKSGGTTSSLDGLVDTRLRATINVSPSLSLITSVNLPTGKSQHDSDEAIVAAALSTELLGFREALWGTGFGVTTGFATAWRANATTGIGLGASYRLATEFEPSDDATLKYRPGNEIRVRLALDKNIGANKLTLGGTFQNYSDDQINGRNLFAPGNRWRGDLTYSFRASNTSTWTLFATDVWRQNGDVSLGDSIFQAGEQNLAVVGFAGALRSFRPSADFRFLTRASGENEGWWLVWELKFQCAPAGQTGFRICALPTDNSKAPLTRATISGVLRRR
jgi:hypothetical protein